MIEAAPVRRPPVLKPIEAPLEAQPGGASQPAEMTPFSPSGSGLLGLMDSLGKPRRE